MPGTRGNTSTTGEGRDALATLDVEEGVEQDGVDGVDGFGRRRFLGYVVGGATLIAAADWSVGASPAAAVVPSPAQTAEVYDLNDFITDSARPTANLVTVTINEDGTASFELPRTEVGQGITTSTAMILAEELDLPVDKVRITLADAKPELVWNQLTGGSTTTTSTYTPFRVAAAVAKGALLDAAAIYLGDTVALLESKDGVITGPSGSVTYGQLATAAASPTTVPRQVTLKDPSQFRVVGRARNRIDALAAVTGRKNFTTDLKVKNALPTMVCRAPTLNGTPVRILNEGEVKRMPGVTHVAQISTGIAVRAKTFGQCIDAVRAVRAEWEDGPVAGQSDEDIVEELRGVQLPPLEVPDNPLARTLNSETVFYFRSNSAMDTVSAIADVREDSAEIWSSMKVPIIAQQMIAQNLGMPESAVTCHVQTGGGSFGRRLFSDGALEAAEISAAMGVPVKLMWHRADDARVGRTHPMAVSRITATIVGGQVTSFQQVHTSVETDYRHGLGEMFTANTASLPAGLGNQGFAQSIFALTQELPYNFGVVNQSLLEVDERFNTGSMRNIYSPDTRAATELMVDRLAEALGMDPLEFRLAHAKEDRLRRVLNAVAERGDWGKRMPAGTAQGIAVHKEYKGVSACLVEIDTRPETVNRRIREAVTGPRVTRVTYAIDAGLVINPRGLEAQMQGGINDGIALALTSSMHLRDGHFVEASWDNYFYTRQWNTPPRVDVLIMPSDSGQPGGAGEAGVAATVSAVACAYARATGKQPSYFPINHKDPFPFQVKSYEPPIPASPVNGLRFTI